MATRKMKRYAEGDIVEGENPNIDDDTRARARKFVEDNASEAVVPKAATRSAPKAPVVTKEELAKSGLSLRDYMNKQQGLTRRGSPAAPSVTDTGDETDRLANRFKKPPLRQETMRERAESYNAKRFAQKAEDAAKSTMPRGQDRILTGIKKKSDENKFMGSTGLKGGGKVSSASRRADGIAIRGKTRA